MKQTAIVIACLAFLGVGMMFFGEDHQDFIKFDAQREDWHRRCDRYIGSIPSALREKAEACKAEMEELVAYGKAKGWSR